ncbi:hypothetical protein [Marinobacter arenosus]|uniref:hypothetical protein n=1 Tax=Marinobacter arenosus TaxID=2856822 RepID=UPI001C4C3E4D|nr:hypothetical protein [Marinobacter arenosus]MBW0149566.1 hypothetical protein [Marinobacter arenosus]
MPGVPRVDKGEGLIRTYDLLQALRSDIDTAYENLEEDRESQFLRRSVVRAVFSYIEAMIECVKVEIRSTIRTGLYTENLTQKEKDTLGSLAIIGAPSGKFLPLDQNLKRTFKLAAKVWELDFNLSTDGENFRDFLAAKKARNKLTHPRTVYDIEVTDDDMHCHTVAGMWVQSEFQKLFNERVTSLRSGLSEEERSALANRTKENYA